MNIIRMEKVSLKNNPNIKEDLIQKYIFEDPSILGLGELTAIRREKIQPSGGRIDLLLADDNTRYEVEVQLGATDPGHIIRTIEYWDIERKRYPQYNHCAVIIAEELTGRFMNVISLFNGTIPLIALQVSAYKQGECIGLVFTKVLDRVLPVSEDEEQYEETDRKYWESRSTPKILQEVDAVFACVKELAEGYELKYNKFYIGLNKEGVSRNFMRFEPKKNYINIFFKGDEQPEIQKQFESVNLELSYKPLYREYYLRLNGARDFLAHKELIFELVRQSMDFYNIQI